MNTPMLSDEPSDACCLGRHSLVDDLCSRITQCRPPQVFGVFGDWGCGKTSFLRHVQWELDPSKKPRQDNRQPLTPETVTNLNHVLWFEAWRYSSEDKPVVALLQEIRRTLRWSSDFLAKAKGKLQGLSVLARNTAIATAATTLEALGEKVGIKVKLDTASQPYSAQLPTDALREQLSETIETLLNARGQSRLVIIIDDLDRCDPKAALRLLEGIKIYLNLSNCVFILGLNSREVQRAIEDLIPGVDDGDHRAARAAEYLEKICGFTLRLPYPNARQFEEFLDHLWASAKIEAGAKPFLDALNSIVCQHRSLPPNARKVKAWANAVLGLAWRKYPELGRIPADMPARTRAWADLEKDAGLLAFAASLYIFHPELYRRLQVNPYAIGDLTTWARGSLRQKPGSPAAGNPLLAEGLPAGDPILADLKRLQQTHWGLSREMFAATNPLPEADIIWQRTHFDPSLPSVFHVQRLLVALDPLPQEIESWFPSA